MIFKNLIGAVNPTQPFETWIKSLYNKITLLSLLHSQFGNERDE